LVYAARLLRILALQLKRIGDLVLTVPALAALRRAWPEAHIALGAFGGAAELLGAFPSISAGIAFGRGRGWAPWQQVLTGNFDRVYDFTGTDRSALATLLAAAQERAAFSWVKKAGVRQLVYNRFVDSAVRERHTVDHYLDLVGASAHQGDARLRIPENVAIPELPRPFAIIHPGTARAEKYWLPERWAAVVRHLQSAHHLHCVLTGGSDPFEQAHLAEIQRLAPGVTNLAGSMSLLTLAALTRDARLVVSCDTGIVHRRSRSTDRPILSTGVRGTLARSSFPPPARLGPSPSSSRGQKGRRWTSSRPNWLSMLRIRSLLPPRPFPDGRR
jgi:ADP-heptose:LPS heptosyltransferase